MLLGGLIGCGDGPVSPSPRASPPVLSKPDRGDSIVAAPDPEEPVVINSGECTLVNVPDGSPDGHWESTCEGISGGPTLPPPLPPPPPPPNFPPPPSEPPSGGGSGGGSGSVGAPDQESGLLCKAATTSWLAALAVERTAQAKYQAAYDAYILKRAEYTAWDNQARADNVYTWAEQMKLNELGSQLWTLETAMKAAKTEYDDAARLQWVMAGSMALVCAFGG